jgi:hypothetical protein
VRVLLNLEEQVYWEAEDGGRDVGVFLSILQNFKVVLYAHDCKHNFSGKWTVSLKWPMNIHLVKTQPALHWSKAGIWGLLGRTCSHPSHLWGPFAHTQTGDTTPIGWDCQTLSRNLGWGQREIMMAEWEGGGGAVEGRENRAKETYW